MGYIFNEESLFSKVQSLVTSICGSILWISTLHSSTIQNPKVKKQCPYFSLPNHGLKTVIYTQNNQSHNQNPNQHSSHLVHSNMISVSEHPLTCLTSYSLGWEDLIGAESGVYMSDFDEGTLEKERSKACNSYEAKRNRVRRREQVKDRQYPPPLPSLVGIGNLPPRHMPWILKRHCENGRLILTRERVQHFEYFESTRENCRLILNLVCLDVNHDDFDNQYNEVEKFLFDEEKEYFSQEEELLETSDGSGDIEGQNFEEHVLMAKNTLQKLRNNGGDLRKCASYGGMISDLNMSCKENSRQIVSSSITAMSQLCSSAPLAFTRTIDCPILTTFV